MTGLELLGLLFVLLLLALIVSDGDHWRREQERAEADLERTRYKTRGEISREKWGRK